jgi:hypothetical protein
MSCPPEHGHKRSIAGNLVYPRELQANHRRGIAFSYTYSEDWIFQVDNQTDLWTPLNHVFGRRAVFGGCLSYD